MIVSKNLYDRYVKFPRADRIPPPEFKITPNSSHSLKGVWVQSMERTSRHLPQAKISLATGTERGGSLKTFLRHVPSTPTFAMSSVAGRVVLLMVAYSKMHVVSILPSRMDRTTSLISVSRHAMRSWSLSEMSGTTCKNGH